MKKRIAVLLICCLLTALACPALGAEAAPREDRLSVTHHTAIIQGRQIAYTATAGTMAMDTELGQYDLFFVAYTMDGVEDPAERPVTFAWNGGPGSASMYVHLGLLGPDRVDFDEDGKVRQVPSGVVPNEWSLLDLTDLVFIDPVGTAFSRPAGDTDASVFYSCSHDAQSVGDFIRTYVNRYDRWASPKYLAGESYGTVRNAGVAAYLMDRVHMNVNGIMMISSANNYGSLDFTPGNELPYVTFLPTYAAAAWYHKKAAEEYLSMDLEAFLEEARAFARGEYQTVLFMGSLLPAEDKAAVSAKLAAMTGLDQTVIEQKNLRIDMDTFCRNLLSEDGLMVGRLDARYTGPVVSGSLDDGMSDPSSNGVTEAFTGAMQDILTRKLNFHTDLIYEASSDKVNSAWNLETPEGSLSQEGVLHDIMSKDPFLKVWVICGYYDLATPFFAAEWVYSHLFLNDEYQKNLSFTYYPSGHMFYLHHPSMVQFRKDAEAWFAR